MTTLNYTIEELKIWTIKRQLSNEILEQLNDNDSDVALFEKELHEVAQENVINEIAGISSFNALFDGFKLLTGKDLYDQLVKHTKVTTSFQKDYEETDEESILNLTSEGWHDLDAVDVFLWTYRIDITLPKEFVNMLNIDKSFTNFAMSNLSGNFSYSIYVNGVNFESIE